MTSGIWLYEIAYHYSWGLDGLLSDLSRLSISLGGDVPFPIYFASFLVALPLVVRQYVGLNRPLLVIAASSAILFVVWLAIGFPQFWCVCSYEPVWGAWLPREIVEPLGYVMNSLTNFLLSFQHFCFVRTQKHTSEIYTLQLASHDVFFRGVCHSWSLSPAPLERD